MAKALIAAVSLALVLVAAVVVPLVVMPGVFGFDDWPEATAHAPRQQVVAVTVPAAKPLRAEREPRRAAPSRPAPHAFAGAPTPVAQPAPQQQVAQAPAAPVVPVPAPAATQPVAPVSEPQAAEEGPPVPPVVEARTDGTNLP